MAKFSETLIRYSPLIGQILGNIDDIRVTRNYNEARKEIENAEKKRQEYQKFLTYNQKLRSIDPSDKDFYNTREVLDPNITGNEDDFYQNTLFGQDYLNKQKQYTETDETGRQYYADKDNNKIYLDQDPLYTQDINKILETNPQYAEDLRQKGFYKTLYEPKDEKEINTLRYTKAGIPEEEAKWYEQYSQTFNPQDYNLQLQRMVLDKYPDLVSSGEYGSKYFDLFGKQMSTMGITAPEYKFSANKDYILKTSDTGDYEVIPIKNPNAGDEQKKQFTKHVNDQKNWYAKQDYKGDWHYYSNYYDGESGTFKEMKMRRMSDEELEKKERDEYEGRLDIGLKEARLNKLLGIQTSNRESSSKKKSVSGKGNIKNTEDKTEQLDLEDEDMNEEFEKYKSIYPSTFMRSPDKFQNWAATRNMYYNEIQKVKTNEQRKIILDEMYKNNLLTKEEVTEAYNTLQLTNNKKKNPKR